MNERSQVHSAESERVSFDYRKSYQHLRDGRLADATEKVSHGQRIGRSEEGKHYIGAQGEGCILQKGVARSTWVAPSSTCDVPAGIPGPLLASGDPDYPSCTIAFDCKCHAPDTQERWNRIHCDGKPALARHDSPLWSQQSRRMRSIGCDMILRRNDSQSY